MSGNSPIPISSRASRLNSLILNRPEALGKEQKDICSAINREGLLDALFVLYNECSKDSLKKRNKNINDFATKCE
jgi:citron Rho-interacting kinase